MLVLRGQGWMVLKCLHVVLQLILSLLRYDSPLIRHFDILADIYLSMKANGLGPFCRELVTIYYFN